MPELKRWFVREFAGEVTAVLHYVRNDQKLAEGELVLIDAGCELEGYASDVTRTYPVGGRFSGPARALYEVVLAAQTAAIERCRPGATLPEIHDAAVRRLVEGMLAIGLLAGDLEELIAREAYRAYYMHSTSHWLGLDVHDVGSYRVGGEPRRLEPGQVFTVEPGLYVSRRTTRRPIRASAGIGVRIEDDIAITESWPREPDRGDPEGARRAGSPGRRSLKHARRPRHS